MARKRLVGVVLLVVLGWSSAARAAPFDIFVTLNPDQTGPSYEWSLTIDVEDGYEFGAVQLVVSGFDGWTPNAANPAISPLDSPFRLDILPGGLSTLVVANVANGVPIGIGPATGIVLGTLTSSFSSAASVGVFDGDYWFGGTVLDPALSAALPGYSITVIDTPPVGAIPESRFLGFASLLIAGLFVARASPSRSREATRPR